MSSPKNYCDTKLVFFVASLLVAIARQILSNEELMMRYSSWRSTLQVNRLDWSRYEFA
ncbi:MAG: hypothetical protein ACRC2R_11150 [Xenococcaceae cyanobacterium]